MALSTFWTLLQSQAHSVKSKWYLQEVGFYKAACGLYDGTSRTAHWDGKNAVGEHVANGVYFYTLKSRRFFCDGEDADAEIDVNSES